MIKVGFVQGLIFITLGFFMPSVHAESKDFKTKIISEDYKVISMFLYPREVRVILLSQNDDQFCSGIFRISRFVSKNNDADIYYIKGVPKSEQCKVNRDLNIHDGRYEFNKVSERKKIFINYVPDIKVKFEH